MNSDLVTLKFEHDFDDNLSLRNHPDHVRDRCFIELRKADRKDNASQPGFDNLNTAWVRAEQQVDDWQSISLQLPTAASAPLTFNIDRGNGGQPQKRAQLVLDRATGNVVRWEPFSSYSRGRPSFVPFCASPIPVRSRESLD